MSIEIVTVTIRIDKILDFAGPYWLNHPDMSTTTISLEGFAESPPTVKTPLSPRVRHTLNHLLDGQSEKEVAKLMGLSRHTVHVYVKHLYRHFGVRTRAELQSWFYKRVMKLLAAGETIEARMAIARPSAGAVDHAQRSAAIAPHDGVVSLRR